ncbi:hypothetical protein PVAND_012982 [Polypedilum vanderplanki]|uniref:Uncharacterized protein n=1 Tax=Polypedilum vanderplanki TaxID=319348 RepID=A0A9J6CP16_POLVA|nr:hypothetical protein PVAND_012982 [Polypedilum vanderplanki]
MWQLKLTDQKTPFVDDALELTDEDRIQFHLCDLKFENFKKIIDLQSRSDLIKKCINNEEKYENDNIKVYIQSLILAHEKPAGKKLQNYHNQVLREFIEKELKCALIDLYDNCDEKENICE